MRMGKGVGKIGYIANSVKRFSVKPGAPDGYMDHICKKAEGRVEVVLGNGVICRLDK